MSHKYARTFVVKYGGAAMRTDGGAAEDPLLCEIAGLCASGARVVVVHGGGPEIDAALALRNIETERIDGMRVTDGATLGVVEATLCGTLNKRLVRAALALGLPAVGVSGEDGAMLAARRAVGASGRDLGYVGEIAETDVRVVRNLLDGGFLPIVAPLAVSREDWRPYNVNADLAAAAIAAALRADAFILATNVSRVRRDPQDASSGIDALTADEALRFIASDACRSSMKPKLQAAAEGVANGAARAYICSLKANTIAAALAGDATIVRE
ncbi:MAG TPA: acetylglutamate kinase [Candidatus Cybelea sp.]|nr:acetylglutamate kinase [Candidatus Cybelea sp.]